MSIDINDYKIANGECYECVWLDNALYLKNLHTNKKSKKGKLTQ